jgi:hypothetical protein
LLHECLHAVGETRGIAPQARQQHAPQRLTRSGDELREIGTGVHQSLDQREHRARVPLGDEAQEFAVGVVRDQAEHSAHVVCRHRSRAERDDLVQDREAVPHGTIGTLRDQVQRAVLGGEPFGRHDLAQPLRDGVRTDAAEVKALEPRQNRCRGLGDLLRLGRGEHEHHAGRRLLEDLEEGIPGLPRKHVRFIHDVHLVPALGRCGVHRALAQIPGVVHATVRRRVELHDVQVGCPRPDAAAGVAFPARLPGRLAALAIERHREDPRRRSLPHAPRPREQVAMGHAPRCDGTPQHRGHMLLHQQVGKFLRPVLSSESDHPGGNLMGVGLADPGTKGAET